MAFLLFHSKLAVMVVAVSWLSAMPGRSQIVPDSTLPVNSTVISNGNALQIDGGTTDGSNLFHSFQDFSLPTGTEAFFNNPLTVQRILTRVTGKNASQIDGLIRANGNANLFLLNPNGILFGSNARLNIGGSFLATTADSILFNHGFVFSASNPQAPPLLAISVPVGLQFNRNPGAIAVRGSGHNARLTDSTRVAGLNLDVSGLQVQPGKTLALVGGNLALEGGLLVASGGRIELGSVTGGSAVLDSLSEGLALSYPTSSTFGNIQMTQRALASASGTNAGAVQIQGQQVSIQDGSMVLVQNQGDRSAGNIAVNATESLQIIGKSPDFSSSSSLVNETIAAGAAGNITITTSQLAIDGGGFILNRTFSAAPGGNIEVNANEIGVNGFATGDPSPFRAVSQLLATTHASGKGGDVALSTQNLSIVAGGNVGARPYGQGNGGNVTVKADTIQVTSAGAPQGIFYFSLLATTTFGSGNTGNLVIDTRTLSVQEGGRVSASSLSRGNSGDVSIHASESIELNGSKDPQNPSYIGAIVRVLGGSGFNANSGTVTIDTQVLTIRDGATVFVLNQGNGNAGSLRINADTATLENSGSISASTKAGQGGNINLQIRNLLQMRHGSFISAEAGSNGNGGNITLNAPIIVGLENSDITANAVQGQGGNIHIVTQGMFGLAFRNQPTLESDITASSQFGVSGTVSISTPDVQPDATLVELPQNLVDPSQQIAQGCASSNENRFVATGRGGLPPNPTQRLEEEERPWADVRDLSAFRRTETKAALSPKQATALLLVEANSWRRNATGQVEIYVAETGNASSDFSHPTCSLSHASHQ